MIGTFDTLRIGSFFVFFRAKLTVLLQTEAEIAIPFKRLMYKLDIKNLEGVKME